MFYEISLKTVKCGDILPGLFVDIDVTFNVLDFVMEKERTLRSRIVLLDKLDYTKNK